MSIYVHPEGNDRSHGRSPEKAVRTLGRAKELMEKPRTPDLAKWLPLWEKCPELQPCGLTPAYYPPGHMADGCLGGWMLAAEYPDCKPMSLRRDSPIAAGLIRDRAALFLAKHRLEFWLRDGLYLARGNTADSQHVVGPWREDPTETLRLALCKALEVAP